MSESYLKANELIVSAIRVAISECLYIKEDGDIFRFHLARSQTPDVFAQISIIYTCIYSICHLEMIANAVYDM